MGVLARRLAYPCLRGAPIQAARPRSELLSRRAGKMKKRHAHAQRTKESDGGGPVRPSSPGRRARTMPAVRDEFLTLRPLPLSPGIARCGNRCDTRIVRSTDAGTGAHGGRPSGPVPHPRQPLRSHYRSRSAQLGDGLWPHNHPREVGSSLAPKPGGPPIETAANQAT
jgi:hypothetical protein